MVSPGTCERTCIAKKPVSGRICHPGPTGIQVIAPFLLEPSGMAGEIIPHYVMLSSLFSRTSSPFLTSSRFLPPVRMIFPDEKIRTTILGSAIR